jgi:hypothetical protein
MRITRDVSRRTMLTAGVAMLATAAPASHAAARAQKVAGLRVSRIGLAAPSPHSRPASLALRGVAVDFLSPDCDDSAANEAFHAASLAGHVVVLDGGEPNRIAARAQAAGVRLFRDHMIGGKRLIQLDPAVFGVRFETARHRETVAPGLRDVQITGLVAACDDPERAAALAGAILGACVGKHAVELGACRVTFVGLEAANGLRGLREVHLDTSQADFGPAITLAGVTWRRRQTRSGPSLRGPMLSA